MATLTKSILPISGYTNQYYTYQCVVTENSYSVANNTSNVTITFSIKGPWDPSFYEWTTYYGIVVDGSVKTSSSSAPYVTTSYKQLLTWTGNIAHGTDGKKTINVGVYLYSDGPANYLPTQYKSGSPLSMGSVTLTTIPRASSVSLSATSINVGSAITANISRASSSFTHSVEFYINDSYYQKYTGVGTSQVFTIPTSWYNAMPSSTSCTAYCRITTYNGGTQVGSQVSKAFTVNVPSNVVPTVGTITLDPANITTLDGTSRNILVQGKNKLTVSVSGCSAGTGSSVQSYTFSGPGISSTTTSTSVTSSSTISSSGTLTYTVKVTDKRGRTASKTATISCHAYSVPYFKSFTAIRTDANGTATDDGTYIKCNYSLGYASVNSTNNVTVKLYYKKNSATSYSSTTALSSSTSTSGNKSLSSIATDSTYAVYATITDNYSGTSSSSVVTVFGASRVFNITSDGTGVAIGKMAESSETFDCRWPIRTDNPAQTMKNLTYRGQNILSTTDDTTATWVDMGNLATVYYNQTDKVNGQPAQYGYLLNITAGPNSTQVHHLWAQQPNGSLFHRGGNTSSGLQGWKTIFDSSNFTSYIKDYVVEQGTSGKTTYRKWNSGVSEVWYYEDLGTMALTTSMAGGVYSNSNCNSRGAAFPSGLFLSGTMPMATINVYSNGYTFSQVSEVQLSKNQFVYRVWSPYSTTIDSCKVSIYAVGKWK